MVVVITHIEKTPDGLQILVSHGVCLDTGKHIVLPCDHPSKLGAVFDERYGEWIIK